MLTQEEELEELEKVHRNFFEEDNDESSPEVPEVKTPPELRLNQSVDESDRKSQHSEADVVVKKVTPKELESFMSKKQSMKYEKGQSLIEQMREEPKVSVL